jgi:hypothetical protein
MNAKQHGRIWKYIENIFEIYRNLEAGRCNRHVSGKKKLHPLFIGIISY